MESGFLCPSRTHLALRVKSIFTSQIMCPVTFDHPTGELCLSGKTSNATPTLCILVALDSLKNFFPFYLLSICTFSMLVGISILYLWVVLRIRDFSADIIEQLLINVLWKMYQVIFQDMWTLHVADVRLMWVFWYVIDFKGWSIMHWWYYCQCTNIKIYIILRS